MLPNNRFWTALPGLVMNGCQFTRNVMNSSNKAQAFMKGGSSSSGAAAVKTAGLSDSVPDYGASDSQDSNGAGRSRKRGGSSKKDRRDKEAVSGWRARPASLRLAGSQRDRLLGAHGHVFTAGFVRARRPLAVPVR